MSFPVVRREPAGRRRPSSSRRSADPADDGRRAVATPAVFIGHTATRAPAHRQRRDVGPKLFYLPRDYTRSFGRLRQMPAAEIRHSVQFRLCLPYAHIAATSSSATPRQTASRQSVLCTVHRSSTDSKTPPRSDLPAAD